MKVYIILLSLLVFTISAEGQDLFHNNLQKLLLDDYNITGGNWLFFNQEQETINSAISYGGQFAIENSSQTDFSLKVKATVPKGENPWEAGWYVENKTPIKKDDILFFTFDIKSLQGKGQVNFFAEHQTTFAKEVILTIETDTSWRTFYIPTTSTDDYEQDELHVGFHLANEEQVIEFGGFSGINFETDVKLQDLPSKTNNDLYGGLKRMQNGVQ